MVSPLSEPAVLQSGEVAFSNHYVSAFINANNVKEYGGKRFLQNSFGLRLGYNVASYATQLKIPTVSTSEATKGKLVAQLHYKLGFGFKVKNRFLMIPTVELPFFNLWPFDFGMGSIGAFNSRYSPVMFNVRILAFSTRFKRYFK